MKSFSLNLVSAVLAAAALFALAACKPADRLDRILNAGSSLQFTQSSTELLDGATPEERRDFDEAQKEIRLKCIREHKADDALSINDTVLARINGMSLRLFLANGLIAKRERLEIDRSELAFLIESDRNLRAKAGDSESAEYLNNLRQNRANQLMDLERKIAEVDHRITAFTTR